MLLKEIVLNRLDESVGIDPLDQLKYNANKLIALYKGTLPDVIKTAEANGSEDYLIGQVARAQSEWFNKNYLSATTKTALKNVTHSGLKTALYTLSKDPKYKNASHLQELASLTVYMAPKDREKHGAKASQHMILLESLPTLLKSIASISKRSEFNELATELTNAIHRFYEKMHTSAAKAKNRELENNKKAEAPKKQKEDLDKKKQQDDAMQIVNHVLSSLDPKIAHEIRRVLDKRDDKLQALQVELTKRNIKL